jgi:hypothetical protein
MFSMDYDELLCADRAYAETARRERYAHCAQDGGEADGPRRAPVVRIVVVLLLTAPFLVALVV